MILLLTLSLGVNGTREEIAKREMENSVLLFFPIYPFIRFAFSPLPSMV